MITGINFNGVEIPALWRRKFADTLDRRWMLQGVCDSEKERDAMLVVGNNGHRLLRVETRRCIHATNGILYGIYVGWPKKERKVK